MKHEETSYQTKLALSASLKKFMAKKPLSKITVSEIIKDCDVNRKTFYYHFEDIYGLMKWTLEQEAIEVVKKYDLLIDYQDVIRFVIRYVQDNAHIINCAYDSVGRDEMKRFFYSDFIEPVNMIITESEKENHLSLDPQFKEFIVAFFTEAIAGMLVNAFKEKRKELNEDEIVKSLTVIIDTLPDILKKAPQM